MILFVFLTGQNHSGLNHVDFQTSSSLSLESNVVQSPLPIESSINSTAFDLGQATHGLEVQPSDNEDLILQSPPPDVYAEQGETLTSSTQELNDTPLMSEPIEKIFHIPEVTFFTIQKSNLA
jgi:hypothetical protein